jgi:predicted regulator of Ras-like GTPase activity (Roadblock/LC7/MglB family)
MRGPPLELQVAQASVSEIDSEGCAVINCRMSTGQQVLLRIGREALVLLCSAATRELRRDKQKMERASQLMQ